MDGPGLVRSRAGNQLPVEVDPHAREARRDDLGRTPEVYRSVLRGEIPCELAPGQDHRQRRPREAESKPGCRIGHRVGTVQDQSPLVPFLESFRYRLRELDPMSRVQVGAVVAGPSPWFEKKRIEPPFLEELQDRAPEVIDGGLVRPRALPLEGACNRSARQRYEHSFPGLRHLLSPAFLVTPTNRKGRDRSRPSLPHSAG